MCTCIGVSYTVVVAVTKNRYIPASAQVTKLHDEEGLLLTPNGLNAECKCHWRCHFFLFLIFLLTSNGLNVEFKCHWLAVSFTD